MSLSDKYKKCALQLLENMPGFTLNPEFQSRIGFRRANLVDTPSDPRRGWARVDGEFYLNAAHLSRFCGPSPYSRLGGKSDMSPTGVACHELGHIVHFRLLAARRIDFNTRIDELFKTQRKLAITSYARSHPHEDFAEAHRLWALNPGLLKELSPERWELQDEIYLFLLGSGRHAYRIRKAQRPSLFLATFDAKENLK